MIIMRGSASIIFWHEDMTSRECLVKSPADGKTKSEEESEHDSIAKPHRSRNDVTGGDIESAIEDEETRQNEHDRTRCDCRVAEPLCTSKNRSDEAGQSYYRDSAEQVLVGRSVDQRVHLLEHVRIKLVPNGEHLNNHKNVCKREHRKRVNETAVKSAYTDQRSVETTKDCL